MRSREQSVASELFVYDASVKQRKGQDLLLSLASLVIVIAALKAARELLLPLVVAMFLATLTAPAVFWLKKRRITPAVSIPLLMVGMLIVLTLFGGFIGGSVNAFVFQLPKYQERIDGLTSIAISWLALQGLDLSAGELSNSIQPGQVMRLAGATLKELMGLLSNALLVLLTTVLILFEAAGLPAKIRAALGNPEQDLSDLAGIVRDIKNYVLLKTYTSVGTGAAVALILWALGVDFPLLWGLLAFLFNYVPNIGSIIAAIPPVLLALVQFGPGRAAIAAAGIIVVNMVVGNGIEPRIMGRSLGLSTLVVFVSLVFWGWVWGPVGMLLSIPLTMMIKIGLEHSERWRFVALLLGNAGDANQQAIELKSQRRGPRATNR